MNVTRFAVIAFAALGFAVAGPVQAQDKGKAKESTPVTKVLFENDKVRIAESTFKPGDVSRSDRKARANYVVKGGMLQRTTKDGKTTKYERKAGTATYLEADSDVVKNIGKTTFVVISTQLK